MMFSITTATAVSTNATVQILIFDYFISSIPKTTSRITHLLVEVVVVIANTAIPLEYFPAHRVIDIVLGRTPPIAVVSNVVECSIVVTVATRKGCKSNRLICCTGICSQYNLL